MAKKSVQSASVASSAAKSSVSVAITSQVLAKDTGTSSTDNITTDGDVTLTGTYAGATGTKVGIYDGGTLLGYATLDGKGHWVYTATLVSGSHSLYAVASDTSGHTATSATEPTITVDTSTPTVAIRYEDQTAGSNTVELWGTVSGSTGTTVEIYANGKALGTTTVNDGWWSFDTSALKAGNYSFSAVATTVAGNSATTGALPSLSVGQFTGTLNTNAFTTVWSQDFTTSTSINTSIFPLFWGNSADATFSSSGITLTSRSSEGFANIGFQEADWGSNLSQGYGLYSVTASTPAGQGGGVALLLWPSNNVWPGPEIDILENWTDPSAQTETFSIHYKGPDGNDVANVITLHTDLTKPTTYSLDWEKGSLTYYINGQEVYQVTGSEVPLDAADGGINAAFGCEIADIGSNTEPTNTVSVTIANISYAARNTQSGSATTSTTATVSTATAATTSLSTTANILDAPNLGSGWSSGLSTVADLSAGYGLSGGASASTNSLLSYNTGGLSGYSDNLNALLEQGVSAGTLTSLIAAASSRT